MRILFVTDEFAQPENTGFRSRVANLLRALEQLGRVEWVVLTREDPAGAGAPDDVSAIPRLAPVRFRARPVGLGRWLFSRNPWRYVAVSAGATRRELRDATASLAPFDIVMIARLDTALIVEPLLARLCKPTTTVAIDTDDLESFKITHRLAAERDQPGLRASVRRLALRVDRRRWAALEKRISAKRLSFVCSELDQERLGGRPCIVPNAAPHVPEGFVRRPDPHRAVLLFVGSLTYEPNLDAVEFAATQILPLVQREIPHAVLRVVGRGTHPRLGSVATIDGVELVGEVERVAPELERATVSLVPLRFGGGTRIKILEALAHEVPVVSTTIGAEGLAVTDGGQCLIADTASTLAAACVRLIRSPAEGRQLAARGAELVAERYDAASIRHTLVALLRDAQTDAQDARSDMTSS